MLIDGLIALDIIVYRNREVNISIYRPISIGCWLLFACLHCQKVEVQTLTLAFIYSSGKFRPRDEDK